MSCVLKQEGFFAPCALVATEQAFAADVLPIGCCGQQFVEYPGVLIAEVDAVAGQRVNGVRGVTAVSYTHLDVYKRQYLRFGINLESNFREDSTYGLRVAYDKTLLNPLTAELIVAAEIGNSPGVLVDYYQPLEAQQRYFFESALSYGCLLYTSRCV